jgi:hypothetical protein
MALEHWAGANSLLDVLDRVLDKGIVIDAWVRVSTPGIDLITIDARVVVVSLELPPDGPSLPPAASAARRIPRPAVRTRARGRAPPAGRR